jgi:hypothetical protein
MKLFTFFCLILPPSKFKNWSLNLFPNVEIHPTAYIGFSFIQANNIRILANTRIKHLVRIKGIEFNTLKKLIYREF